MKTFALVCYLLVSIKLCAAQLSADKPIQICRNLNWVEVLPNAQRYLDTHKSLRTADLLDSTLTWQPCDAKFTRLEQSGRYWFKFTVENVDSIPLHFDIVTTSIEITAFKLFVYHPKLGWDSTIVTGSNIPFEQRPYPSKELFFRYLWQPHTTYTCFVYMERGFAPAQTALFLANPLDFQNDTNYKKGSLLYGALIGMGLIHFLIGLWILLLLRNNFHLAHVSFALGSLGYVLASSGLGVSYFWRNAFAFEEISAELFAILMLTGLIWMAKIQLCSKTAYPWLHYLIHVTLPSGWLFACFLCVNPIFPSGALVNGAALVSGCLLLLTLPSIAIVAVWDFIQRRHFDSLWFIVVFAAIMTASVLMLLTELGFIARTDYINNSLNLHTGFVQTICMTIFIASRTFTEIENRKVALMEKQLAHQQQLQRIATDLHDEVGSTLSSIAILSETILQQTRTENNRGHLSTILKNARQVMENMYDIVWSVNPENDGTEILLQQMKSYALETLEAKDILLHFSEAIHTSKLPSEQRKAFYLIFKEAINNAAKYANAQNVWVKIQQTQNEIQLHIQDDGQGFDLQKVTSGNGLKNMQMRAAHLAGHLELKSTIGQGTVVALSFPLSPILGIDSISI